MSSRDDQCDEAQLRAAVLGGNAWAWRTIYDRHFGALYGFVLTRAGRDRHWTEDVVQETWLTAAREIRTFDPERGQIEGWLRGIAENQLRNHRRREDRRRMTPLSETCDVAGSEVNQAIACEQREGISLTFATLPFKYQDVLRAKYEEQLPTAEIAARWGATNKSVESLLGRARAAFRDVFRQLCGEQKEP